MTDSFVTSEIDGSFLHIALNRPEKRNALTGPMMEDLAQAICRVDDHPEVRAVIVTGNGPIFSAGIDITALGEVKPAEGGIDAGRHLRRVADRWQSLLHTIEGTEVPVIGALHGQVLGMGLELALAFDLRVATDDCLIGLPETRMGLVADVGGTSRLMSVVGPSRAKDMLLTARNLDAAEALQWGLVNRVVPTDELQSATLQLAQQIAANAPLAVGMAKRVIDQSQGLPPHAQMTLERWAQSQLIATDDLQEAVRAFMEKRKPNFQGK